MDDKADRIIIRIDPDSKQRYQAYCDRTGQTMSGDILRHIYAVAPPGIPVVPVPLSEDAMTRFTVLCQARGQKPGDVLAQWVMGHMARLGTLE